MCLHTQKDATSYTDNFVSAPCFSDNFSDTAVERTTETTYCRRSWMWEKSRIPGTPVWEPQISKYILLAVCKIKFGIVWTNRRTLCDCLRVFIGFIIYMSLQAELTFNEKMSVPTQLKETFIFQGSSKPVLLGCLTWDRCGVSKSR